MMKKQITNSTKPNNQIPACREFKYPLPAPPRPLKMSQAELPNLDLNLASGSIRLDLSPPPQQIEPFALSLSSDSSPPRKPTFNLGDDTPPSDYLGFNEGTPSDGSAIPQVLTSNVDSLSSDLDDLYIWSAID